MRGSKGKKDTKDNVGVPLGLIFGVLQKKKSRRVNEE